MLQKVEVEYLSLPGWKSNTEDVRSFKDLPENAQNYVMKIQELMGVPGNCVIVCQARSQGARHGAPQQHFGVCMSMLALLSAWVCLSVYRLENRRSLVRSLAWPIFFSRIDDSYCDRIHFSLTAVRCLDNSL